MSCLFLKFEGSLEQMFTFASTYIYFPFRVVEIAVLGWGGGVYCFTGGLLFTTSGYIYMIFVLSLRPLVLGGCLGQMASEGWEPCLQATLTGTGLVARRFYLFQCFIFQDSDTFFHKNMKLFGILSAPCGCPSEGFHVHACMCMCLHPVLFFT